MGKESHGQKKIRTDVSSRKQRKKAEKAARSSHHDTFTEQSDLLFSKGGADLAGLSMNEHINYKETNGTDRSFGLYSNSYMQSTSSLTSDKDAQYIRNWHWWIAFISLVVLSAFTRLYKIEQPATVCWDETHFGKMGSWYINRSFFFDVHPPVGKMLIGLAGHMTGYNGSFPFSKPGDSYEDVPYVGMRMFCAGLGSALAPLTFSIVWELCQSLSAATLAAILVIFDTGTLTLSKYILLDPIMLFFIMAATCSLLKFQSYHGSPFGIGWWFWLILTGIFLACSVGVKFVGLFVVFLVGCSTILDLWQLLGDLTLTMATILKHFLARAACLIALPVALYLVFFAIHFKTLSKSGSGDGFFSSAFQSQLEGNPLYNVHMPEDVAYGSVLTIKNHYTGGAYLHSHWHLYPDGVGARQQQVTTYGHKDENNKWMVKRFDKEPDRKTDPLEVIRHGDFVRLEHVQTRRNLHSHRIPAPLTHKHQQVTCYGENGTGDSNDVFKVNIIGGKASDRLKTVRSVFRLIHVNTGCVLYSHSKQLPKWGYEQFEVTCNPNIKDNRGLWNIEEVIDKRLKKVSFKVYAPSFLQKFIESHAVMFQGNSGLKPKEGEVTSKPWQWPLNYRGQPFSGPPLRVYLLGNPVTWWTNIGALVLFLLFKFCHALRAQRGHQDPADLQTYKEVMFGSSGWLFLGWTLHYIPFWFMGRVLYFHHYFPSALFNFMLTAIILDYVITSISLLFPSSLMNTIQHILYGAVLSVIIYSFYLFSPLSYGMTGPDADDAASDMHQLKWLDTWAF